jgi:hypothetical protein
MGILDFLNFGNRDGASARHDRHYKFSIRTSRDAEGEDTFVIENSANKERLRVPRYCFENFRAQLKSLLFSLHEQKSSEIDLEIVVSFQNEPFFRIQARQVDEVLINIRELRHNDGRQLNLSAAALGTLLEVLHDDRLKMTSEALNLIVAYHKLFQFTFAEGSDSINSDLALRKDVLCVIDQYTPPVTRKLSSDQQRRSDLSDEGSSDTPRIAAPVKSKKEESNLFKSKLGERSGKGLYQVDYSKLLAQEETPMLSAQVPAEGGIRRSSKAPSPDTCYSIPLLASEVKQYKGQALRCELATDDMQDFRSKFLANREQELFLGVEIVDAIYKQNGRLMTFNFPLYYLRVNVSESNRSLIIEPAEDGKLLLNHIALANLVLNHGAGSSGKDPLEPFLTTLLAQRIEVDGHMAPVRLSRKLPVSDSVFEKNRTVFLGSPDEGGRGGILSSLKLLGIECDLDSVFLYRTSKNVSPLVASLETDLDQILRIANDRPRKFSNALLGKFLASNIGRVAKSKTKFCDTSWVPGAMPKATRRLMQKLNEHDLVLLEGPPGTGKTFTIFNLLIHCICTNKRLLIVSDQSAAIHALVEKFEEYIYGRERGSASQKSQEALWKAAIKVIDKIPKTDGSLSQWCALLKEQMDVEGAKEFDWPVLPEDSVQRLADIDRRIRRTQAEIQEIMEERVGPHAQELKQVAGKRDHDYTLKDIQSLTALLDFLNQSIGGVSGWSRVARFIKDRRIIAFGAWAPATAHFEFPETISEESIESVKKHLRLLRTFVAARPRSSEAVKKLLVDTHSKPLAQIMIDAYATAFPNEEHRFIRRARRIASYVVFPLERTLRPLIKLFERQLQLMEICRMNAPESGAQWQKLHKALTAIGGKKTTPVVLEIIRERMSGSHRSTASTVQSLLEKIDGLQKERDEQIKQHVIGRLGQLAKAVFTTDPDRNTNAITSISTQLDALKSHDSLEGGRAIWEDFREQFRRHFPVVICRKQAVSFLFPCAEQSFDLVIVDEATQCRVDDALPLLFRGSRILVVGDEKQTVLAKDSVVDDYLYDAFALEEHLRATQAHGMKGGGSHIFGLVKGIKQGSVMLDEHYRCPPGIIEYSNKYVYGSELKVMQWIPSGAPESVIVDFSEAKQPASSRQEAGQYKGIETDMVDRFLDFVAAQVKQIEKETGERINMETDVALCYFLLKNEPYVKRMKAEFLRKLGRGDDVLDGAGAALQGKERNYIFYLWDVTRSNMMAFKQGDEADKRKGELNVLMSRPKRRAYHFLHGEFSKVDHSKATIADYLWRSWNRQSEKRSITTFPPRTAAPDPSLPVWQRASGQLLEHLASMHVPLGPSPVRDARPSKGNIKVQYSVSVGDPRRVVDLMLSAKIGKKPSSVGIVDLAGFEVTKECAQEVVDYYFQLSRAVPKITPVFAFIHEVAANHPAILRRIREKLGAETDNFDIDAAS